jgi:MYXO-CTERM domain-containing protein
VANCVANSNVTQITAVLNESIIPGGVGTVVLTADGAFGHGSFIGPNVPYTGFHSAKADPMIRIDPSFPYADDFDVIYRIDPAPASTPEPATGLLALLGAMALTLRRKLRSVLS